MHGAYRNEGDPHTVRRRVVGDRARRAFLHAKGRNIPSGWTYFARSACFKAADGTYLRRLRVVLCALRDSHGATWRSAWRQTGADTDCAGMVRMHRSHWRSVERRIAGGDPVSIWSRRGRMFFQPDAHAECVAARTGTSQSAVLDVVVHAMGRSGNTAAGFALHPVVRLEMGVCELCRPWVSVVSDLSCLVQRRPIATHRREFSRERIAGSISHAHNKG